MTLIAAIGWLASAYITMLALPAQKLDDFNTAFAVRVDAGESYCWSRVDGEAGEYGSPSNYSIDVPCKSWKLPQN